MSNRRSYRYALYFAPSPASPWRDAGCRWVGRDSISGRTCLQPQAAGVSQEALRALTADARRYGFHATLKAPFRLARGFSESHLAAMADAFCAVQKPVALEDMQVRSLGNFLALCPSGPLDEIGALAMRCVSYFDLLRAAPDAAELAKRRRARLSERQEAMLQRWGYPYVDEEFRFHMTLTDSLAAAEVDVDALRAAAEMHFSEARAAAPLLIDALSIFREEEPGAPMLLWRRVPFQAALQQSGLPMPGRLFFCVGPSGAGKDALLQWVRDRMPADAKTVFARRTITRPAHASEAHEATDEEIFWRDVDDGRFAMHWQANGLCYGIPRSIEAELSAGRDVIVNGSREYVPQLRQQFPEAIVIWIDAEDGRLLERLEARQREAGAALLERIERARRFAVPDGPQVIRLDNSGALEIAGRMLLEILAG